MNKPNNYWQISWGSDEAKGDVRLPEYFVPIPEYKNLIAGEYRYIIGRKGTGKTAICEQIKNEATDNPLWFYRYLSLRDFPASIVRSLGDKHYRDKSKYVPIWKFLILIEISKMILDDNGVFDNEVKNEIRSFLELNFPCDFSFVDVLKILDKKNSSLSVKYNWLNGSTSKTHGVESVANIHYQKISAKLTEIINKISTDSTYFLVIDELDEGYKAGEPNLRLILLALLRAVEDSKIELNFSQINYRPILALRSDIFDRLEDNDLNKLDDYVIRLKWYSSKEELCSLNDIVNARISASLNLDKDSDHWHKFVNDLDPNLPYHTTTLWKYITNRTFERPRDIIKFLKYCSKIPGKGMLHFDDVYRAELKYSDWFYRELRDELHSHLPVWKETLDCITRVGSGIINDNTKLIDEFKKDFQIVEHVNNNNLCFDDLVRIMFDFGLLGNLNDKGTWLFKYKDDDLVYNPSQKLIVHFGFSKKLKLKMR